MITFRYAYLFIRASFLSALATFQDRGLSSALRKVWRAFKFMADERTERLTEDQRYYLVEQCCRHCVIFNQRYLTCGTFGVRDSTGQHMGCLCFMPEKAKYRKSECWLYQNTDGQLGYNFKFHLPSPR